MRVGLITGTAPRHAWLAGQLDRAGLLAGLVTEPIRHGCEALSAAERRHFGKQAPAWPACGPIREPDLIVLYGCALQDVTQWNVPVVNLHLGLSPWYRGSGTTIWPIVNRDPQMLGATIHLAMAAVDGGPILHQVRPVLDPLDTLEGLGLQTLKAAAHVLPDVLKRLHAGTIAPVGQDLTIGRVYRRKDLTPEIRADAKANLAAGLLYAPWPEAKPLVTWGCTP